MRYEVNLIMIISGAYYCTCRDSVSIERRVKSDSKLQQKRRHERLCRVRLCGCMHIIGTFNCIYMHIYICDRILENGSKSHIFISLYLLQ